MAHLPTYQMNAAQTQKQLTATHPGKHPLVIRLDNQETQRVVRQGQTVRIINGSAWITLDSRDIILRAGEALNLTYGNTPAVISPVAGAYVVYEID